MKPARRYLAVHLPFWEAEHLRQSHPDLPADTPLALWARQGARRLLVAVDQAEASEVLEAVWEVAVAPEVHGSLILYHY